MASNLVNAWTTFIADSPEVTGFHVSVNPDPIKVINPEALLHRWQCFFFRGNIAKIASINNCGAGDVRIVRQVVSDCTGCDM